MAETIIVMMLGIASLWMLCAGAHGLVAEGRLIRRLAETSGSIAAKRKWPGPELLRKIVPGSRDRAEIERDLRAAGYSDPRAPLIFAGLRLVAAISAGLVTAILLWASDNWNGGTRLLSIAATGFAYVGAKLVLRGLAAGHMRRVSDELPFALDLMTMMLETGVSLDQCFRTLAGPEGNAAPAIRDAMSTLVEDVQRGMSYAQAFDRWSARLGVNGAHELAGLFRQSISHGTELGPVLREFARDFTDRRVSRARESIGRKTTKMAIVMMVFMMPALFIVLCGPALATIAVALSGTRS